MIRVRKEHEVFVYGTYDLLMQEHPRLFIYTRTLEDKKAVVICNFSKEKVTFIRPGELSFSESKLLLNNYQAATEELPNDFILEPYETRVYLLK